MDANSTSCVACGRNIDAAAKVCPYCGADPSTGQKLDTQAMLQEVFRPKEMTTGESVLEYARQRQGIVVAISAIVLFLILALLHQFVTARNASAVSAAPPIPLTEVADLSGRQEETPKLELPKLDFAYDGQPQAMRTFLVEPGAAPPPEIVAAQQAAQQAAQPPQQAAPPPAQPAPPRQQ